MNPYIISIFIICAVYINPQCVFVMFYQWAASCLCASHLGKEICWNIHWYDGGTHWQHTIISKFLKTFKWPANQIFNNYNKELFQREIVLHFQICWFGTLDLSYLSRLFTLPISKWRAKSYDFSTVYSISLTQDHSGSQSFLLMIHFHCFCFSNIYMLLLFKFKCSHPEDV